MFNNPGKKRTNHPNASQIRGAIQFSAHWVPVEVEELRLKADNALKRISPLTPHPQRVTDAGLVWTQSATLPGGSVSATGLR